jgi:hypothetical protein
MVAVEQSVARRLGVRQQEFSHSGNLEDPHVHVVGNGAVETHPGTGVDRSRIFRRQVAVHVDGEGTPELCQSASPVQVDRPFAGPGEGNIPFGLAFLGVVDFRGAGQGKPEYVP